MVLGVGALLLFRAPTSGASVCQPIGGEDMVRIPGGEFVMGSEEFYPEEAPHRTVSVAPFWIDRHELTNDEFARFVAATGYKTSAELSGGTGSAVFKPHLTGGPAAWRWEIGAQWRKPEGRGSSIGGRGSDPVVLISIEDAQAYARWAGKELPSEEEWEYAARGGLAEKVYPWGDDPKPAGKFAANTYQGAFPVHDTGEDGYAGRAPVGCFAPNGFGLYDMTGNVWEWTASAPRPTDPVPDPNPRSVIRGGSYLCSASFCARYRPSARQFQERDVGTNHIGVRFVRRGPGASAG
jgi:formylglycine-generating enzyme